MRRYHILPALLILFCAGCNTTNCDKELIVEASGIEMLSDAKMISCTQTLKWMGQAVFSLSDDETDQLYAQFDFEPVRKSLEQVDTPFRRINKLFAELDQLYEYEMEPTEEHSCKLVLKKNTGDLVVIISRPDLDWGDDGND